MTDNNGRPHTHQVRVERRYESIQQGDWYVDYGYVRETICSERHLPTEELTVAATKRAIKKHDDMVAAEVKRKIVVAEAQAAAKRAAEIANSVVDTDELPQPTRPDPGESESHGRPAGKVPWYRREVRRNRGR